MKRQLLRTPAFLRATKKLLKRNPQLNRVFEDTVRLLREDAFDSRLKTHKLTGELSHYFSCSAGYDLRIIFSIVPYQNSEAVLLDNIGTHDEVY